MNLKEKLDLKFKTFKTDLEFETHFGIKYGNNKIVIGAFFILSVFLNILFIQRRKLFWLLSYVNNSHNIDF